jgi:hypothetical protein
MQILLARIMLESSQDILVMEHIIPIMLQEILPEIIMLVDL